VYCIPNHELGLGPVKRRSSSLETVDATQAARIRLRDRGVCAMCRTAEGPLEIGHLLPLAECRKYPSLRQAMGSDENLALMCRECNADLSVRPVSLLWMAALHMGQERS
jgi:5-methylcytosine-specific restriction endonuclease McrA